MSSVAKIRRRGKSKFAKHPSEVQVGDRFNRWTITSPPKPSRNGKWFCRVTCRCGTIKVCEAYSVISGRSRNCGCYRRDQLRKRNTTHGESATALYGVWQGMRSRCEDPQHSAYYLYGARGIYVCKAWRHYPAFAHWAKRHGWRQGLHIDRIDNFGPYSPSNCRIATPMENCNNKRNTRYWIYKGVRKTARQWSQHKACGVPYEVLRSRLALGWAVDLAMRMPTEKHENYSRVSAFGETKSLKAWAEDLRCRVGYFTLHYRIHHAGWDPERAVTTSPRSKSRHMTSC